jgi:tetratricopeptide (TPR) repeat protein
MIWARIIGIGYWSYGRCAIIVFIMLSLKSLWVRSLAGAAILMPYKALASPLQGSPAVGRSSVDGQVVLANAIHLQQAGDFEGAIRQYQIYLATSPTGKSRMIACSNLGAALAHLGRYSEAIEQYHQALRLLPEGSEGSEASGVRFNLAVAYYKAGQIPDASREFLALSKSQPGNMNVLTLLADCDLRMGENKKVVELLSPVESTHGIDGALTYLFGTALIRDNQIDRGQKIIDRILRDGESAEARLLMGNVKLGIHDIPGALVDLRRAVELNSKMPSANALYAQALLQSGNPERARESFKRELEVNPNDFDSNLYLGVLARQDENFEDAGRFLQRALQVRPGDLGVRYQIGALHLSLGKIEEAQGELEQVINEAPNFVEAHVSLARTYYREKRKQDGDRERATVNKLIAETQASQPGAKDTPAAANSGEAEPPQH